MRMLELCRSVLFLSPILIPPLHAEERFVECGRNQSLNTALQSSHAGETIIFTGSCHENVSITRPGITLKGYGSAAISPLTKSSDALTVRGVQRIKLRHFTVENGLYGVHAKGNAGIALDDITVQSNARTGILIEGSSSADISDSTTSGNGLFGIDAENSSSLNFTRQFSTDGNAVFGMNLGNSSSATLAGATFEAGGNVLGIQTS